MLAPPDIETLTDPHGRVSVQAPVGTVLAVYCPAGPLDPPPAAMGVARPESLAAAAIIDPRRPSAEDLDGSYREYLANLAVIEACPHRGEVVCGCSGEVRCAAGRGPRWRPDVASPSDCHRCVAGGGPPLASTNARALE